MMINSCTSLSNGPHDVYFNPDRYLDEEIQVCGRMRDSSNLIENRTRNSQITARGLAIIEPGPLGPFHRGQVCVVGTVVFVGCLTADIICTDWAYDYGIEIHHIVGG